MTIYIKKIAQQAQLALLYEVSCFPKPGLVDPLDQGSHKDMDIFTFLESSVVLLPFFEDFIKVGYENRFEKGSTTFDKIRKVGLEAEDAMNEVTKQVNTHKGIIFSLGIFLTVCGRLEIWRRNINYEIFQSEIKALTENVLTDFQNIDFQKEAITFGELLYIQYGITGIRGEAVNGYPNIFEQGIPFYERHRGSQQAKLIDTLLYLSMYIEDTNLIKRSKNVAIMSEIKPLMMTFFEKGGYETKEGYAFLQELNDLFKQNNWSIGGSADALILVIFLSKLKELALLV